MGLMRRMQPDTPLVLVAPDVKAALAAMRQGAYDYLLRPIEKDELLATMRRAIDYRRLVQQNAMYRQDLEQMVSARTGMLNQAIADLERSYDITLEALGDALDLKDAETEGHSKRVTAFTIALARGAGIPPQQITGDRPRRVSARYREDGDSGRDSAASPASCKRRAESDAGALCAGLPDAAQNPFFAGAAEIVYSHQEHYDGSGYPRD